MSISARAAAGPSAAARLRVDGLAVGYGDGLVIEDLSWSVPTGAVSAIIGPNGCGKSTLLRTMGRLLSPRRGSVTLDGRSIGTMKGTALAREVGMLPQSPQAPEGLSVADLVNRGRHPHQRWYQQWSTGDADQVRRALALTGMDEHAGRTVDELSGGQRQRAWISMTLAQDTGIVLLDEPITFLDLAHQVEVLDLVRRLPDERGTTVVMVLHDLNLAARYADRLLAMRDGAIIADGTPEEVLTEARLAEVFGLEARVLTDPLTGSPMVLPAGPDPRLGRR